jgi:transposase-like protein
MGQDTQHRGDGSKVVYEHLESYVRGQIQDWIQDILEEEVGDLLGRQKHERRAAVDAPSGYRNGHGKPRRLSLSSGTITVRRPRVRDLDERFESRILPLFLRRTREVGDLLPELYLHGLSEGDFDLALRGLLGDGAPLSASSIARLKEKWQAEYSAWKSRSLMDDQVVYIWVDGVYVKAGFEKEKAALLVVIGALRDGRKVVLAVESGYRESIESWSSVLRDLKSRGMNSPRLVIGDGHLGIWGALANVYPDAAEQRCWNHRIVNVLDRVPKREQGTAKSLLMRIPYASTRVEAETMKREFSTWCAGNGLDNAATLLDEDWERMTSFYAFPKEQWTHLRTTNVVESPFAAVRLRTSAAKRFKKVENAVAVIWKTLTVAEGRFRRLNAPELLGDVASGATYVDGVRQRDEEDWEEAAG